MSDHVLPRASGVRRATLLAPILTGLLVAAVGVVSVWPDRPALHVAGRPETYRDDHDIIATNLVEHGRFTAQLEHWDLPSVARGPLYPLYLAAIFKAFGVMNLRAVRVSDELVHALAAALLVAALQTLVPTGAATAAGLAYAFWPTTFYFVSKGSYETLMCLLLVAGLFCLIRLKQRPTLGRAIALGICLGAACLVRGNAVVMFAIAGAWAAVAAARRSLSPQIPLAIVLAWALTMSPWWIRNARVTGEFVPFHTLMWFNAYYDDVFDQEKRSLAARGDLSADARIDVPSLPGSAQPPGAALMWVLDAREDLAQERRLRQIMLKRYRDPGYLARKLTGNAVDFWSASGTVANDRKLLATSLAWLTLFAAGLFLALRDPALRWCVLVCSAFVVFSWLLYMPFYALFRYSVPTAPFVAATIGLGLGALWRRQMADRASRPAMIA